MLKTRSCRMLSTHSEKGMDIFTTVHAVCKVIKGDFTDRMTQLIVWECSNMLRFHILKER